MRAKTLCLAAAATAFAVAAGPDQAAAGVMQVAGPIEPVAVQARDLQLEDFQDLLALLKSLLGSGDFAGLVQDLLQAIQNQLPCIQQTIASLRELVSENLDKELLQRIIQAAISGEKLSDEDLQAIHDAIDFQLPACLELDGVNAIVDQIKDLINNAGIFDKLQEILADASFPQLTEILELIRDALANGNFDLGTIEQIIEAIKDKVALDADLVAQLQAQSISVPAVLELPVLFELLSKLTGSLAPLQETLTAAIDNLQISFEQLTAFVLVAIDENMPQDLLKKLIEAAGGGEKLTQEEADQANAILSVQNESVPESLVEQTNSGAQTAAAAFALTAAAAAAFA